MSDPERVPLNGSGTDSDPQSAEDEDLNGSGYEDSNFSDDSNSLNSDIENEDDMVDYDDREASYLVRSSSGSEFLLPLDEMNEEELEGLLEQLEKTVEEGDHPVNALHDHSFYQATFDSNATDADVTPAFVEQATNKATAPQYRHKHPGHSKYKGSVAKLPHPSLPFIEVFLYFCIFLMMTSYSLYKFYSFGQKYLVYLPLSATHGGIWGRQRDDSDIEWYVWPSLLKTYLPYILLHTLAATFVRKYAHRHLCALYITGSVCVIYMAVGSIGLILCVAVPSLVFTVLLTRNKQLLWVTWCLILLFFNVSPVTYKLEQFMASVPEGDYKVSVMVAWIIVRSLSYALETCDADPDNNLPISRQLLTLFAYCFYLPFLFTGPYMPYVDFMTGLNAPYIPWNLKRVGQYALQVLRFSFWMCLANFLLHHFYAHALHWSPQMVTRMDSWSMAGFLYYLICFFIIKYVVLYGIPGGIASIEGYKAPPPPKCVIFIWRFSQLWRDFDHGLYLFMTRHIYLPWVSASSRGFMSKLQGTALVFTFVYVWHGVNPQVMMWSGINFCGVMMEKCGDAIASNPSYQAWQERTLSPAMRRRFHACCCMLVLMPSVTALAIFLTSLDNASTIGGRVFLSGFPVVTLTLTFFMYCLAQSSFEMHNWKAWRGDKSVKIK
ncbi:Membrane bound O-acyl transferase MBOAT [Trinorchestia longiramus]|nr:Membrane bound O-acyl transferase MBOAT [Trinorchestia longiramus]